MICPRDFEGLPLEHLFQALDAIEPSEFDGPERSVATAADVRRRAGRVMGDPYKTVSLSTAPDPAAFLPRQHPEVRIPSVDLVEYLGSGAQGKVYSGVVRSTGLVVAVKVLSGEGTAVREALICSRLRHRNIVRIFDVQRCGAFWVSIMEMVHGHSLTDQASTPRRTRHCFAQLADTVAFMAEQRVVHCDIKPPNILCRQGDETPVLLDFGMAVDQSLLGKQTEALGGTPRYLPPEAFAGSNPDSAWDAYSLGITAIQVALPEQSLAELKFATLEETRAAKVSGEFQRRLDQLLPQITDRTLRDWCGELVHPDQGRRMSAVVAVRSWAEFSSTAVGLGTYL